MLYLLFFILRLYIVRTKRYLKLFSIELENIDILPSLTRHAFYRFLKNMKSYLKHLKYALIRLKYNLLDIAYFLTQ